MLIKIERIKRSPAKASIQLAKSLKKLKEALINKTIAQKRRTELERCRFDSKIKIKPKIASITPRNWIIISQQNKNQV